MCQAKKMANEADDSRAARACNVVLQLHLFPAHVTFSFTTWACTHLPL
jgi:hypothetical protein